MCLWFGRRNNNIESSFDPRFGSASITSPNQGAYTNPTYSPPPTVAQPPTYIPLTKAANLQNSSQIPPYELSPAPGKPISQSPQIPQIATLEKFGSLNPQLSSRPISNETRFTNSTVSSPTTNATSQPSPSSSWEKRSIISPKDPQNPFHQSAPQIQAPDPLLPSQVQALPLQNEHLSRLVQRTTSPTPLPVHHAYIPAEQLSTSGKLSPGMQSINSVTSMATSPTSTINHMRDSMGYSPNDPRGTFSGTMSTQSLTQSQNNSPNFVMASSPGRSPHAHIQTLPGITIHMETITLHPAAVIRNTETRGPPLVDSQIVNGNGNTAKPLPPPAQQQRTSKMHLPTIKLGLVPKRDKAQIGKKAAWDGRIPGREEREAQERMVEQWPGEY